MTEPAADNACAANVPEGIPLSDWQNTPLVVRTLVLSLQQNLQQLQAQVQRLSETVGKNSQNSSKPPSSDPPSASPRPPKPPTGRKRGGQPGHPGKGRLFLYGEGVDVVDVIPSCCATCQAALSGQDPAPARHQVTEIPLPVATTTEYRLHTLTCPCCGAKNKAERPEGVPASRFGPRLTSLVALLSGRYHLSDRLIRELLADLSGVKIGLGSISALKQAASAALAAGVEAVAEAVRSCERVNADETSWSEGNRKVWLWTAVAGDASLFVIEPSRSQEAAKSLLGADYAGVVGTDRYGAYNWIGDGRRQFCWAHLKRDFTAFVERGGSSAEIGEALLEAHKSVFVQWALVREGKLAHADLRTALLPVMWEVSLLLEQGSQCEHKKTAGTCAHLLLHEASLWTFAEVEGVEPTNNAAERALRPAVLWRKGSFGTQSEDGSHFVERVLTTVTTLRQQGRHVLSYLSQACEAAVRGLSPPSLLAPPAAGSEA